MENLLKRRFFFDHSFAIYGGLNGLYDYGPMGCAMKSNLLDEWRRFFVLEEQMLQVDCATLTPLSVLSASGHLTRFVDLMVKDTKTGECFRADHLIEEHLRKILAVNKKLTDEQKLEIEDYLRRVDKMNADEMSQVIGKFAIRAPETDNELSEPVAFNLMFSTLIGPTGHIKGLLIWYTIKMCYFIRKLKCLNEGFWGRKQLKEFSSTLRDYSSSIKESFRLQLLKSEIRSETKSRLDLVSLEYGKII